MRPLPQSERGRRVGTFVDAALAILAAVVTASTLVAALHDVSQAWDSGYYHLPFAARLAGIVAPGDFVFHPANAARFEGFPLLGERLQGLLWRATGRPECANLVAFSSVPLLAWFLWRRFAVPLYLTALALFAVPLVQTHATSAYVDLPANAAVSVVVLLTIEAFALTARVTSGTLAVAGVAAAIAANMKALLHPIVALALVALVARALPAILADVRSGRDRARGVATLAAIVVGFPLVFATPLANLVAHANPYYPVRMSLLGHVLPGTEAAYSSSPPWLSGAPRPVRFACSLLEIGIRPLTEERRWTVDQWMPDASTGNRLGGFFGVYVVANLAALLASLLRDRSRAARAAAVGFAVLTAVVSVMPQSHELRYYLCWMIVLVTLNLWLTCRASPVRARAFGAAAAIALAVVVVVTRGDYVVPAGSTFASLLREKVDARVLDGISDGERVCVLREPWNILWAPELHPPRHYSVVEAEEPRDCAGARLLE